MGKPQDEPWIDRNGQRRIERVGWDKSIRVSKARAVGVGFG